MFPLGEFGTPYFRNNKVEGPTLTDGVVATFSLFNVTLSADSGRSFSGQESVNLRWAVRTEAARLYSDELHQRKHQLHAMQGNKKKKKKSHLAVRN